MPNMADYEVNAAQAQEALNVGGAIGRMIPAAQAAGMVAAQREYAARSARQEALRMAYELLRGTDLATDSQALIRAARDFLAFIDNG